MGTRRQKRGECTVPQPLALEARLVQDEGIGVALVDGKRPAAVPSVPTVTLDGLVAGITEEIRHGEVSTGPAMGNEAW